MLRARLCDRLGPRWTRSIVPGLGLALVFGGPFAPATAAARAATVLAGVALMSWASLLRIPRSSRDITLRVTGNGVEITDAGALTQRLRAADIRAARTSRSEGRPALALVRHSAPERPLVLELVGEEDEQVRRALGIGSLGFGALAWPTEPTAADTIRRIGSGVLGAGWFAMAINAALDDAAACLALAFLLVPLTCAALMAWLVAPFPMPRVALAAREVTVYDRTGRPTPLPYADIVRITGAKDGLLLEKRSGGLIVPTRALNAEERRQLQAQIESAMQRAAGDAEQPPALDASLAILAPRDESKRAWLERLDASATSLTTRDAYRRADLATNYLWDALENPDVTKTLRAAAARVLLRVAPAEAKRIARALYNERDDHARAYIGAALEEDTEAAASRLDGLG